MIRVLLILSLFLLSFFGFSQSKSQNHKITVTTSNATSDKGKVYFSLYDSEANFTNRKPLAKATGILNGGVCKVEFTDINPGDYVVLCYHDANDNGKMDYQPNGMPIEEYGMSNNVMSFGPPQFSDGAFKVSTSDVTLNIKF
jgi:uncharacterized protein (DUF2141 family)